MNIAYHVASHDGGYAYRLDGVWSETFADHATALSAARQIARRQQVGGRDTRITYQTPDGQWHDEVSNGGDRPEVDVVDG